MNLFELVSRLAEAGDGRPEESAGLAPGLTGQIATAISASEDRALRDLRSPVPAEAAPHQRGIVEVVRPMVDEFAGDPAPQFASAVPGGAAIAPGSAGEREMTVVLELDRAQLARTVVKLYDEERARVGVRLTGGEG